MLFGLATGASLLCCYRALQTGTASIVVSIDKHFANEQYSNVIYINFVLEKKYTMIVNDGYDVETVLKNISRIDPSKKFVPGETIIIFDEIQEYLDVATTLKAFRIDGRYDVICSGSMLGINYRKIHSNSVGNKIDYEMFSMDFEEFLWAREYTGCIEWIKDAGVITTTQSP